MKLRIATGLLLCAVFSAMASNSPSSGPIGFVKTVGNFTLDGSPIRDNATLFNGSVVETSLWPSRIVLQNGTHVDLAKNSRTRVYLEHVVLEKGMTQVIGNSQFPLVATTLHITSSEPFRVAVLEHGSVSVTATDGPAQVRNAQGYLVAVVKSGSSLNFQDTGAPGTAHLTGIVGKIGPHCVIRDTTTNLLIEIVGEDLDRYLGKSVEVTGTVVLGAILVEGASGEIRVRHIELFPGAGGTGGPGGAPTSPAGYGGLTPGAKAVILAGILISATLISLALAGLFSGTTTCASTSQGC